MVFWRRPESLDPPTPAIAAGYRWVRYAACANALVNSEHEHIRSVVTSWAAEHPEIEEVILFGSRARGDQRADSDVDLALVVGSIEGESAFTRYYCDSGTWKSELADLLGIDVDLVRRVSDGLPEIQQAIESEGVTLYCKHAA